MTDRVRSLSVLLDNEYRVDDVQVIIDAIAMIKGVSKVERGPISDYADRLSIEVAKTELAKKMWDVLK
jgi:hypothetical protein